MSRLFRSLALIAPLLLAGCYYDSEEYLYPSNFCDLTNVTYATRIEPIILARCATPGCHVAGGAPGDFTTYAGVKTKVDNGTFTNRVLVQKNMPPSGALSQCDLDAIAKWITAGAQNN